MEDYDYEMPTPCQHCGEIFELNDGYTSEKWYPNTVICENCHDEEESEIEDDDRWYDLNIDLSNAIFDFAKDENGCNKLSDDNKESIKKIFQMLHKSSNPE